MLLFVYKYLINYVEAARKVNQLTIRASRRKSLDFCIHRL